MTVKSIVEIEIKDGAWKSFNEQTKQHQAELKKMPGQWGAVGKSLATVQGAAAKFTAQIKEQAKQFKEANGAAAKLTLAMKASDRVATSIARSTLNIARNLKDSTKSLLSWGAVMGLISGVLGAGGLFGIARLAQSAAAGQGSSARSGSTYGQEKAATVAYGQRLGSGNVSALLEKIMQDKQSTGGNLMLGALGMDVSKYRNMAPADILGPYLLAAQAKYQSLPKGIRSASMKKLAPDLDEGSMVSVGDMGERKLSQLVREYEQNKRIFDIQGKTLDQWSKLDRAIEGSGIQFQKTIIDGLTPLTPALIGFMNALNKATKTIMGSPLVGNMIKGASAGIEKFSKYLMSENFSKDLDHFLSSLQKCAEALVNTAEFLNKWLGTKTPEEQAQKIVNDFGHGKQTIDLSGSKPQGFAGADTRIGRMHTSDITLTINNATGNDITASAYAGAAR